MMGMLFYLLTLYGGFQMSLASAECTHEKDTTNSFCVSRMYCNTRITLGWHSNCFNEYCTNTYSWNCNLGETIYTLKGFPADDLMLGYPDVYQYVITGLDLSYNEYTAIPKLPTMERLKSLNLSNNALTEAKFYNRESLPNLSELDLSHNTISSILVDNEQHVFRNLRSLNLSHNYLVVLPDGAFDSFFEIEYLDLSFNFIDLLSITSFEGMRNLINLNLKHNRLSDLHSSLFRFNKLNVLDLSENKIQNIQYIDFEKLVNLTILDLSNNLISAVEENALKKNCFLIKLDLSSNLLEDINKDTFSNMKSLKNVNFANNRFKSLPRDLFKDKRISDFSISENSLQGSLVKGYFEGLKLIIDLDLSNQQLTSIEDFAFYGLEYLKILTINNNKLQTISKRAFHSLRSLDTLDLSNNQLMTINFDKDELFNLRSLLLKENILFHVTHDYFNSMSLNGLYLLDLSRNNISVIEMNSFNSLSGLINFQIANNPLNGELEENTFVGLSTLPSLDISGTLLTAIKNGSFGGMIKLKELNVSHCNVSELQYNSFSQTGFIETIDISYNRLKIFHLNTTEMINLNKLILNNNLLTVISSATLKGLPRLTSIIVSHNQITTIDDRGFQDQNDLRHLDLSYNSNLNLSILRAKNIKNLVTLILSGIKTNITFQLMENMKISHLEMSDSDICNVTFLGFKVLKRLESLVLNHNDVTKIEVTAFNYIKSLIDLDLSYNKITFIQSGAFKDNTMLRVLNISHNMLTAVTYGMLRGLLYLETIDMSFNDINDLKSQRFYEVQSLSTLIADHNKINDIAAGEFIGTRLSILSIGANPIPCHVLVNLKHNTNFAITAITLDENSDDENVDGVTCNMDRSIRPKSGEELSSSGKILIDLKDILLNLTTRKDSEKSSKINSKNDLKNLYGAIEKMNSNLSSIFIQAVKNYNDTIVEMISNLSSILIQGNQNTSNLFNRLIYSISQSNNDTNRFIEGLGIRKASVSLSPSPVPKPLLPPPKPNITLQNLIPYINRIKQELEDTIAIERQNTYNEIDKRLSKKQVVSNYHTETSVDKAKSSQGAFTSSNFEPNSLLFIEVCVGLMLFVMLGFILYKVYNSGIFVPNRYSSSTRHLPDAMENSTL